MRRPQLRLLARIYEVFGKTDHGPEQLWRPIAAVLVILALQLNLAERFTVGPNWFVPTLEGLLLIPFTIAAFRKNEKETAPTRIFNVLLIAVVVAFNLASLILLIEALLRGKATDGIVLLENALKLWITNVIAFGMWYWEMDRGGPSRRRMEVKRHEDFLFPQMANTEFAQKGWVPDFWDYLYVSFTNASAFSPTDTMPLTGRAKMLMTMQSLIALLTITLVAARAVNILK
ncbi:DUF1345 domain-containing protein (plasmid) [Deinococcus radiomollis]|uniref:hypothetical protein n=1 Tax=Deinococcus radiomollis TaxID=468916 RepID=UPI003891B029